MRLKRKGLTGFWGRTGPVSLLTVTLILHDGLPQARGFPQRVGGRNKKREESKGRSEDQKERKA